VTGSSNEKTSSQLFLTAWCNGARQRCADCAYVCLQMQIPITANGRWKAF